MCQANGLEMEQLYITQDAAAAVGMAHGSWLIGIR